MFRSSACSRTEVVLVKIVGGGHTWPGGRHLKPRVVGPVCRDINASEMILDFFLRHSRKERSPGEK